MNLKPFKKGHDSRRNMKGAPPKLPDLNEIIATILGDDKKGKTALEEILAALLAKASKGDIRAAELLLDRGYGKAKQTVEVGGKDGSPIKVTLNL